MIMVITEPPVGKVVYVDKVISVGSQGSVYKDIHGNYWKTVETEWTSTKNWVVPYVK